MQPPPLQQGARSTKWQNQRQAAASPSQLVTWRTIFWMWRDNFRGILISRGLSSRCLYWLLRACCLTLSSLLLDFSWRGAGTVIALLAAADT